MYVFTSGGINIRKDDCMNAESFRRLCNEIVLERATSCEGEAQKQNTTRFFYQGFAWHETKRIGFSVRSWPSFYENYRSRLKKNQNLEKIQASKIFKYYAVKWHHLKCVHFEVSSVDIKRL